MSAASARGVRIPDDVALAAFDDPYFGDLLEPSLTAVAYDPRQVGATAAELLIDGMRSPGVARRDISIRSGSSAGVRAAVPQRTQMNGNAAPAITFRDVTKRYGTHDALQPTSLEIEEGEFFCLLGPSGCGKTTTLNSSAASSRRRPARSHPRRERQPAAAAQARGQHRLPELRALPAHDGARQRRIRAEDGTQPPEATRAAASKRRSRSSGSTRSATGSPYSSREDSSSASPSHARSSTGPPCCCSTNRSAHST